MIVSDGWERGDLRELDTELARLSRQAHRLIWVNPLKGHDGFAPLAGGMRIALRHSDEFVEGHNLVALEALADVITGVSTPNGRATEVSRPPFGVRPRSAEAGAGVGVAGVVQRRLDGVERGAEPAGHARALVGGEHHRDHAAVPVDDRPAAVPVAEHAPQRDDGARMDVTAVRIRGERGDGRAARRATAVSGPFSG